MNGLKVVHNLDKILSNLVVFSWYNGLMILDQMCEKRPSQQVTMTKPRVKRLLRNGRDRMQMLNGERGLLTAVVITAYDDLNYSTQRADALAFFGSHWYQYIAENLDLPPDSLPDGLAFEELP